MNDGYDEEREDYASLADEMNDGPPHVGPWDEADWEPRAVENGKRYAAKHGLAWPPQTGDFDRYCERLGREPRHVLDPLEGGDYPSSPLASRRVTVEHERVEECALVFQGHVAAPGYGVAYECETCRRPWLRIGAGYVDPRERVYELTPEDVR